MRKTIDLTKKLLPYTRKKLWVALSQSYKEVIAKGKDPKEVIEKARKKAKPFVIIQAIPDYSGFIPISRKK